MTSTTIQPTVTAERTPQAAAFGLWPIILVALIGVLIISLPNLLDPMMRHDDYPALFAEPDWFWNKTLHEGRWLNYLWHMREIVTPAWLNFAVYQILWAIVAAALALAAMGRNADRWFTGVLALFILVSIPSTKIMLWFNTLIPGLAIVALYAVLSLRMSRAAHRALLPPFVIASFMAYTTYPMLLLAVCLFRTENRSLRDLVGLLVLFVASFASAILVTYAINWQVHGIFGIPLAGWREATPATGLGDMAKNLPLVVDTFATLIQALSWKTTPIVYFHLATLTGATLVLVRLAPKEALYLHAGLWLGGAMLASQSLKLGVQIPVRSFIFVWVFYAAIVVRAAVVLGGNPGLPGRLARALTLLIVMWYLVQTVIETTVYRDWQGETRALATAIKQVDGPILIYGDVTGLSSGEAAGIQSELALSFRVKQLTGRSIVLCQSDADVCAEIEASAATADKPAPLRVTIAEVSGQTRLTYPIQ